MNCNICDTKLKCIESRTHEQVTYRRYKCFKCNKLMYTEEYPMYDEEAKSRIYDIKKAKRLAQS